MLVWAYHPKLRPVAVAVVAIAVVVAVEAVDKWESYSWCRASPAFAPTQPLPLSWAVSVLSRGSGISKLYSILLQFREIPRIFFSFSFYNNRARGCVRATARTPEAPSRNVRWLS